MSGVRTIHMPLNDEDYNITLLVSSVSMCPKGIEILHLQINWSKDHVLRQHSCGQSIVKVRHKKEAIF